jgi:hypothetical protein
MALPVATLGQGDGLSRFSLSAKEHLFAGSLMPGARMRIWLPCSSWGEPARADTLEDFYRAPGHDVCPRLAPQLSNATHKGWWSEPVAA